MSQYLNIFMQDEDGKMVNICNFHHSHPVCDALSDIVPWGKAVPIDWQRAFVVFNNNIGCLRKELSDQDEFVEKIQGCNNTLNEKNEYIHRYVAAKRSIEDTLKEHEAAKNYIELLMDISETSGRKIVAGIEVPMKNHVMECVENPEVV